MGVGKGRRKKFRSMPQVRLRNVLPLAKEVSSVFCSKWAGGWGGGRTEMEGSKWDRAGSEGSERSTNYS